jgi:hypothetical protein
MTNRRLEGDAALAHGADGGERLLQGGVAAGESRFHDAPWWRSAPLLNSFLSLVSVGIVTYGYAPQQWPVFPRILLDSLRPARSLRTSGKTPGSRRPQHPFGFLRDIRLSHPRRASPSAFIGRQQPPTSLHPACDFLGLPCPNPRCGNILPGHRPQSAGLVAAARAEVQRRILLHRGLHQRPPTPANASNPKPYASSANT